MSRIFGLAVILSITSFIAQGQDAKKIVLGAEQLDIIKETLKGKAVGVMVNQSSLIDNKHLVDVLISEGINIKKIFAPEHGIRGKVEAGEEFKDDVDSKTGLPVISLYGKSKKPTKEQIADLDIVVFDIQDVGVRYFTYISSLYYLMEACGESNKAVLVLDRPNPHGGYVDGPMLEPEFESFVGLVAIPIVHGMTVAELAQMMIGEKWLKNQVTCKLEVIPMKNYERTMSYTLPVRPSPNLPTQNAILWYPSICLFEGTAISVGRGTKTPFEVIGSPELKNQFNFKFTPVSMPGMSLHPPYENRECYGLDLRTIKPEPGLSLKYLIDFYNKYPNKSDFFISYFNTLAGTAKLKEQIISGMSEDEIKLTWQRDLNAFKARRAKYLLYE